MDVTQEWRRLQELYAEMSEDELEMVAQDAYDLTDVAKQALQAEVSRRHLDIKLQLHSPASVEAEPQGYPPGFNPADLDLIGFSHVDTMDRARQVKECLDAAGIPSYFGPELVDDLRLLHSPFEGEVEVKIRETDKQRAIAELRRCAPPSQDDTEETPDFSGHCPKCHSTEIVFQGLDDPAGESESGSRYNWSCDACGYQWKDDGLEAET
jgi:DNA-directed RNA polymerase subunit M/transcription elongation factor TFIIS